MSFIYSDLIFMSLVLIGVILWNELSKYLNKIGLFQILFILPQINVLSYMYNGITVSSLLFYHFYFWCNLENFLLSNSLCVFYHIKHLLRFFLCPLSPFAKSGKCIIQLSVRPSEIGFRALLLNAP